MLTDSALPTGTDRVAAALRLRPSEAAAADVVVNVQGDEPLVQPEAIDLAASILLTHKAAEMATLSAPLPAGALQDASKVKVVCGPSLRNPQALDGVEPWQHAPTAGVTCREALFFSRAPIGIPRDVLQKLLAGGVDGPSSAPVEPEPGAARLHVGMYAFRPAALQRFVELPVSRLEQLEQLEQLRALEAGMRILVGEVEHASFGVDTREDVLRIERMWREANAEERRTLRGGA